MNIDADAVRAERLARALEYPYAWPNDCYLFHDDRAHPVSERATWRQGRVPVLAYGSNRAPMQLARKFPALPRDRAILVERCRLAGFDVVHSAHVTRYGAVPAALSPCDGVEISVAVTWLDPAQARVMDESELAGRNYGRQLLGRPVRFHDGSRSEAVEAYLTCHGALAIDGAPAAHADIEARGRGGRAWRNAQVLALAHRAVAPRALFEDFVVRLAEDEAFRETVTERLKQGL